MKPGKVKKVVIMREIKTGTKKSESMLWELENVTRWNNYSDIYDAYDNPSCYKVRAWNAIVDRAYNTPGYNHDLRITGRSCFAFSTIYSYTDEDGLHIVKDTKDYTYHTIIVEEECCEIVPDTLTA